ncbi:ionotropic receptor 93a isoform X3 [Microplitis demolitor]|uniref:ionotropic receptor 93a isoform X3 n=1 Tax=Microplitis demolitor TaxID=69319 RepID=UPI00235B6588|nr:ionotropic receptor 93a isoform X3 [Microplitis demolitor]
MAGNFKLFNFESSDDKDCPRIPADKGISIPLIDVGEELPQIFYDLRMSRGLDWNRVNFIHDDAYGKIIGKVIEAFSDELPESKLGLASHTLASLSHGRSEVLTRRHIRDLLSKYHNPRPIDQHFLVIVDYKIVPLFIETARAAQLLHPKTQWLFVVPDMPDSRGNVSVFVDYLEEGENLAFLYNFTKRNLKDCRAGAVCHARELVGSLGIALEKVLAQEIKLYESITEEEFEASGVNKFVRSRNIITYMRNELYNDSKSTGRGSTCNSCIRWVLSSAITWGNKFGQATDLQTHELQEAGTWTPDPGYESKSYIFPHAIYGFLGKTLPVAIYHNPPWHFEVTEIDSNFRSKRHWDGFIINIINELSRNLNFTIKYIAIEAPSKLMTVKNDPKKSVMSAAEKVPAAVTELVRNRNVLMAACSYATKMYMNDRKIKFTKFIATQSYGLLSPKPQPVTKTLLFTTPFSNEAWACLASSILLVGPILYLVHTFSPRKADEQIRDPDSTEMSGLGSLSRCVWYIYGALLQQGGMHLPATDGARLIVGTWWLVVMVIVATYSGTLVAFLTFPRMEPPVDTVDALLARREEFTWSLPSGSFLENILSESSSDEFIDYRSLLPEYDGHARHHETVSYEDNVEMVKNGGHVLIDWTTALMTSQRNYHIYSGECLFLVSTDVLEIVEPIAMAVPADSPYLGLIDVQLQRMHEAGLIGEWSDNWMSIRDECLDDSMMDTEETSNHTVDFYDMQGIFFVLFLEESNPWRGNNPTFEPVDGLDTEDQKQTELHFLTNNNELITITTMTYTTVLPFCYFPSLHAAGLEFPLDDPRYTIMILVPNGNNLLRDLRGIKLRKLRQALTPNWVRATIPPFMLKGFVTLTGWLQKLGVQDAFEPRAADLSLMSPDLGIYARDVQQSIGVNIRNFAESEVNATKSTGNNNPSTRDPIPFVVDRPFIFFIIDTETSVSLIAGRVNDPLNSRII